MSKKISVITVVYNNKEVVMTTLDSVANQDYPRIEHILVDGWSSDGTRETILHHLRTQTLITKELHQSPKHKNEDFLYIQAQHKQRPNFKLKFLSQRDGGIYDAMNKGITLASGDIIGFLNSDDLFFSKHSLSLIAQAFKKNRCDCVFGQIVLVDARDKVKSFWMQGGYSRLAFFLGWHPAHPTFYVRSSVYERLGCFDLEFKIASDYELMLRLLQRHRITSTYLPQNLVKMRLGGASNASYRNILQANLECFRAWRKNQLSFFPLFILFKPLRKILNRLKQIIPPPPPNRLDDVWGGLGSGLQDELARRFGGKISGMGTR